MIEFTIRPLAETDRGFVVMSWRQGAKEAPTSARTPWHYFKATTGKLIGDLVNGADQRILAAYTDDNKILGWICYTPGKRTHTLHWVYVKHGGDMLLRRKGLMMALLDSAHLGERFAYTMRARKTHENDDQLRDGSKAKSFDMLLAEKLQERGINAAYVPLKEFLS